MSSNSSNESIAKDISTIIDHYDSLRKRHNDLARETAKGLRLTGEVLEEQETLAIQRHKKLANRIALLGFAIAVQALYLILFL